MHPVLIQIGSFTVYTYGALILCGFLLALLLAKRLAIKEGIDPGKFEAGALFGLIVGFAGTKVLYVITQLDRVIVSPLAIFDLLQGGLVFYGAPLAAIPFVLWYVRRHDMPLWKVLDITMLCMPLAHALGRLGCFFAGCCHGSATELPWGVRFNGGLVEAGLRSVAVHPTQLYSSFLLLLLFVYLWKLYQRRRFEGQVFFAYLFCYPLLRSCLEVFRGDASRGFVFGGIVSTSQFISLLVMVGAMIGLWLRIKAIKAEACEGSPSPTL